MKNTLLGALALMLFLTACNAADNTHNNGTSYSSSQPTPTVKVLNAKDFQQLLAQKSDAQLLDVRTPQETAQGMIEGAKAINFYAANFQAQTQTLDKDKPVFIYCRSGARSAQAVQVLKKQGFNEIYELRGGYNAWPK